MDDGPIQWPVSVNEPLAYYDKGIELRVVDQYVSITVSIDLQMEINTVLSVIAAIKGSSIGYETQRWSRSVWTVLDLRENFNWSGRTSWSLN